MNTSEPTEKVKENEHTRPKRIVVVYLDGVVKKISAENYSTEELIRVLDVEPGYLLNVINAHGQLVTLQPGEKTHVKEGMKFVSQVPGGGSS
jgi:predicted metallopeptidase